MPNQIHFIHNFALRNPRVRRIVSEILMVALMAWLGMLAPNAVPSASAHFDSAQVQRLFNPNGTLIPQALDWSSLPNNGLNGSVNAIAVIGSDLYVGGWFTATADGAVTNLNNIAKYSGGTWSALPNNGLNRGVSSFAVSGSDLYVGGFFTGTADGAVTLNKIAKFSGGAWSALPNNGLNRIAGARRQR